MPIPIMGDMSELYGREEDCGTVWVVEVVFSSSCDDFVVSAVVLALEDGCSVDDLSLVDDDLDFRFG